MSKAILSVSLLQRYSNKLQNITVKKIKIKLLPEVHANALTES